jgi:hypothetical protein
MRFVAVMVMILSLAGPVTAQQACGPVVRDLGGGFFMVQCNGVAMQVNDAVSVRRDGQEIAKGKVARVEGSYCSVMVPGARRLDMVYLLPAPGEPDRGPALPPAFAGRPRSAEVSAPPAAGQPPAARSKRDMFFSGLGSGGRVLNLSTGEIVTDP